MGEAEALRDLDEALAQEPDNVQTLLDISLPLARAMRAQEAAAVIRRATELAASATQLLQPVHSRSVGKWRRFETMLAPFVAGLDPALWPEIAA